MKKKVFFSFLAIIILAGIIWHFFGIFIYSDIFERKREKAVEKIEHACYVNDYETAHQILSNLRQKAEIIEYRNVYLSALETVYTSELTYIVLNYPEDFELRIKVRMNEIQALGKKPVEDEIYVKSYESYDYENYELWLLTFNTICRKLFDLAISLRNQHLAQLAVSLTKENLIVEQLMTYDYRVQVVNTDRESITSKYEDAVKSGLFD